MEREVNIDVLGLPEKIVRLLGRNGMKTANDMFAHLNKDYLLSLFIISRAFICTSPNIFTDGFTAVNRQRKCEDFDYSGFP